MKACWDRGWVRKILDELLINSPLNQLQGDFFNWASPENVSRLAPPKTPWLPHTLPHFEKVLSRAAEREEIRNTLTLSNAFIGIDNREMKSESGFSFAIASQPFGGGQSRDIFRGGPVKKTTLYIISRCF